MFQNIQNNEFFDQVQIFNVALESSEGLAMMRTNLEKNMGTAAIQIESGSDIDATVNKQVHVMTLDQKVAEMGLDRVDLVKIDTEGQELNVIIGGKETLAEFSPGVWVEAWSGERIEAINDIMMSLGFRHVCRYKGTDNYFFSRSPLKLRAALRRQA